MTTSINNKESFDIIVEADKQFFSQYRPISKYYSWQFPSKWLLKHIKTPLYFEIIGGYFLVC